MPSLTIDSEKVGKYLIEIELQSGIYKVTACPIYSNGLCGYPTRKTTYTTETKARNTFRRYCKEFSSN